MTITQEPIYAECTDCEQTFADREEAREHSHATMAPTGESSGVTASGHGYRVVNPTPDEVAAQRVSNAVSWAIETALDDFVRSMERDVELGDLTAAEVTDELRMYPDFADAWAEYAGESL